MNMGVPRKGIGFAVTTPPISFAFFNLIKGRDSFSLLHQAVVKFMALYRNGFAIYCSVNINIAETLESCGDFGWCFLKSSGVV
ncbi:MAG: hypothetical protein RR614_12385, partial [Eubacterium sp.]